MQNLPLQGIRVIDYSHFLAGPYVGRCLAAGLDRAAELTVRIVDGVDLNDPLADRLGVIADGLLRERGDRLEVALGFAAALERLLPGQQLVQHDAGCVNVCSSIDLPTSD